MKKISFYLMVFVLTLGAFPSTVLGAETSSSNTPKEIPIEIQQKLDRLEEIKGMDKSDLTSVEKKELRKEVKTIKADLKSSGKGIYLSVGAVIIIILLLILLL